MEEKEEVVTDALSVARQLVDLLAINQGKIERLKEVTSTSHTSVVSAENLLAMLTPNELERKCNVDQWFKKVRKVVLSFLTKMAETHPSAAMDLLSFAHFMQAVHPPVFLDRPPAQSQSDLPDAQRCIALCDNKSRCFRQRHRNHGFLCTYHQQYLPFGVAEPYCSELRNPPSPSLKATATATATATDFVLSLRLVNYRGYFVYVDLLNNNVYHMSDIYCQSPTPRVIGKYKVETDEETLEEKYTIPVLDSMLNDRVFGDGSILEDA